MKRFARMFLAFSFMSVIATSALGQAAGPAFTFDELGNGFDPAGAPLPSGIGIDPLSGIATLFYILPFAPTSGDVLIFETDNQNVPSDLLRFEQPNNTVFVFSDVGTNDPGPDPADVGLPPPPFQPNNVSIFESGPEGNNGAVWAPPPGGPGAAAGFAVQYNFISDIPEPTTLALVGMGGVLALICRRWKRA